MQIARDTVVSLTYRVTDDNGNVLDESNEPISYLHGGYDGIFPRIEEALQDQSNGFSTTVRLSPEDAFGEYDDSLVRVEPREIFPIDELEVGMQFEGSPEGQDDEVLIYTVTAISSDSVTVDGNHPLAGRTLNFQCQVTDVRQASAEELAHGHVHGAHGHEH